MRRDAPYDQYRELLVALTGDEIPLALLDEAGARCGWWSTHRPWQRSYGRFHLGEEPLLTLIYETTDSPQEICVIELRSRFPAHFNPRQSLIRCDQLGWFCLTRFPHDPALPALSTLLASPDKAKVMRYRPGKRCTIRFTRSNPAAAGEVAGEHHFAKHFTDGRGADIHAEGIALYWASQTEELAFAVAPPLRWDEAQQTLWQGAVPGAPLVANLFSAEGPRWAERMGRAAASLPRSSLLPRQRSDAKKQYKRSAKYAQRLGEFFPNLRAALELLLERLATLHATAKPQPLCPIHGAPHPHQWLADGTQLGLVDFDGFAWGDPELDVATFMTEMDFEDWEQVPVAAINQAFQQGYEAVYGPLDQQLLEAYCAHKRLSKALRNAYAIRGDNDMRVERALGQALVLVC